MITLFKKSPVAQPAEVKPSWFERLKSGLARSSAQMRTGLSGLWSRDRVDEAWFQELEDTLLMADVGPKATGRIIADLRRVADASDAAALKDQLSDSIGSMLAPLASPLETGTHKPFVIMTVGVNGAGKTTTIGKLARHFLQDGKTVMLAAGDTFRAAAREQLATWGERSGITVISQTGADPAAVIFDAVQAAKARGIDVVIADTAGRLPTQLHLMDELKKIRRVLTKADETAPHEILLVLDANTGQNARAQVDAFDAALGVTGLVLTKLDGTARGGAVLGMATMDRLIPIRFVGVGEGIDDLQAFEPRAFTEALLG